MTPNLSKYQFLHSEFPFGGDGGKDQYGYISASYKVGVTMDRYGKLNPLQNV
jgi:hypothetical protein